MHYSAGNLVCSCKALLKADITDLTHLIMGIIENKLVTNPIIDVETLALMDACDMEELVLENK